MFQMFKQVMLPALNTNDPRMVHVQNAISSLENTLLNPNSTLPHAHSQDVPEFAKTPVSDTKMIAKGKRKLHSSGGTDPGIIVQITPNSCTTKRLRVADQQPSPISEVEPRTPAPTCMSTGQDTFSGGRAHKGSKNKAYSIHTRMMCIEDFFAGTCMKSILTKYQINSERSVRRWLNEYGNNVYDEALTWGVERQKSTFRLDGAGHPLEDPGLEKHLLDFMAQLREDKVQFLAPLLVMEALFQRPNFKGGHNAPNFKSKVANFMQSFIARNNIAWRTPTTIGQKLPQGWMGKWFICSMYYY